NHAKIRGKAGVLAVPYEEESAETAAPLVAFFEKSLAYLEMPLAGRILVPGVGERGAILKKDKCLAEAFALGQSLARGPATR
ncbi:MAG: hypothetical protein JXB04_10200, partial [Kiritimatiellae bacterium]|nr:hypothetical protein [Kiritimatiellia bacterium]